MDFAVFGVGKVSAGAELMSDSGFSPAMPG